MATDPAFDALNTVTEIERFESKIVRRPDGCWIWTGSIMGGGYGGFWLRGRPRPAHRVAYEHWVGTIPPDLHLDHLCRVRNCVNPRHLEPVTCRENLLRGQGITALNASKTRCPAGHLFDVGNTSHRNGRRYCKACRRDKQRVYMARRRQAA